MSVLTAAVTQVAAVPAGEAVRARGPIDFACPAMAGRTSQKVTLPAEVGRGGLEADGEVDVGVAGLVMETQDKVGHLPAHSVANLRYLFAGRCLPGEHAGQAWDTGAGDVADPKRQRLVGSLFSTPPRPSA
jgi:hypothetical protein